jgi:hypothetical protein
MKILPHLRAYGKPTNDLHFVVNHLSKQSMTREKCLIHCRMKKSKAASLHYLMHTSTARAIASTNRVMPNTDQKGTEKSRTDDAVEMLIKACHA